VCRREHTDADHPQTCPACLGAVRDDLQRIPDLMVLAEQQLADWWPALSPGTPRDGASNNEPPMPGGDLLVLVGPGAYGRRNPDTDIRPGDPEPVLADLAWWEDDWRRTQHQRAAETTPVLTHVAGYLDLHLTWAAQHYPPFTEFARAVREHRTRLETELRDGIRAMRGVACFDCNTTLVRGIRDPKPCRHEPGAHVKGCDQGGLEDYWKCPRCKREYLPREYWFAVRAAIGEKAS
jgi:hypothetical protein